MNAPRENPPADPRDDGRSALDWARDARLGPELARSIRAEVRRRRRRRLGATAAVVCGVFALLFAWRPGAPAAAQRVATNHEKTATVIVPARQTLADGTRVTLKPGAEIRAEFSPAQRRVALLQGEALFEVAKNPARPFVVAVRGVEVRAVGTAFSVGVGDNAVDVLVTEGVVAVDQHAPATAPAPQPPRALGQLTAGQRAVVELAAGSAPALQSLSPAQAAQRLAWRVPRLQFSGTPLAEVIALFREHGGVRLQLADPVLGSVRVSGVLRANNSAALLRLLAADHAIVAEEIAGAIVLRRGK